MTRFWYLIFMMVLGGCATQVPVPISKIPDVEVSVAEVKSDLDHFVGTEVRWGGVITAVENRYSQTWVELVSQSLNKNGRPYKGGNSDGRFIANINGFVDPVVYRPGDLLTIVGTVEGSVARPIGEFDYLFPLVAVDSMYLWRAESEPIRHEYYPSPRWYYDPWVYHPRRYYYPRSHGRR